MGPDPLRYLQAVSDHGGVRAAARVLGVSPSTVSRELRSLSAQFDLVLIDRVDGQTVLTHAAESLLHLARRQNAEWERTVRAFREASKSGEPVPIKLAAFASAQQFVIVDVVKRLRQTTPVRVHLVALEPEKAWRSVANADVDGAVSIAEMPHNAGGEVVSHSLWRERFVLTVSPELQTLNTVSKDSGRPLDRMPWVLPPAGSVWDRLVRGFFRRLQIRPRVIGRSDEWPVIQQMAVDLGAATLMPATTFSPDEGTKLIAVDPDLLPKRTVTLLTRNGAGWRPQVVHTTVDAVRAVAANYGDQLELPHGASS